MTHFQPRSVPACPRGLPVAMCRQHMDWGHGADGSNFRLGSARLRWNQWPGSKCACSALPSSSVPNTGTSPFSSARLGFTPGDQSILLDFLDSCEQKGKPRCHRWQPHLSAHISWPRLVYGNSEHLVLFISWIRCCPWGLSLSHFIGGELEVGVGWRRAL